MSLGAAVRFTSSQGREDELELGGAVTLTSVSRGEPRR